MKRLLHVRGRFLPAIAIMFTVVGCASSGVPAGTSTDADADKVLLDRGHEALKDHKWTSARQYFTKLLDSYPQSPLRADAKLGVGDTYLGEDNSGAYVFALNEFREFLAFYPTSPRADYAQFQLGMVHFKQMLAPGRDATEAKEAVKEFQTFVDHYPSSPMLPDAQAKLREAKDRIGDAEYGVGLFYVRIKNYPGAESRFKGLLGSDPDYTHKDALYFYLADALEKSGKAAEALPYLQRLVDEYSQSQYLEEAKRRIGRLKGETPADK